MNRFRKALSNENTYIVGIICFLLILTSINFMLLEHEDITESDSDKEYLVPKSPPRVYKSYAKGIRLTFIHNFNDSVVISWFTEKNVSDPLVVYSTMSDLWDPIVIKASSITFSSTFIHTAELTQLLPNKKYFYQIRSDKDHRREILSFKTMPTNTDHFSFLVYGDSRTQRDERRNLAEKIMANFSDNIQFTVHTGDIVENGLIQTQWNNYFNDTECLNSYKQGIYVEGNHEGGIWTKMYHNLPMRNNFTDRYYSFSYMDIGFIILVSSPYAAGYAPQTEWLNQTLIQFSQENLFNFVLLHHPLLNDDRTDVYFRENWKPLFDKYNVSLIFCGHDHHYARSYPITNSTSDPIEYDNSELYNYTNLNNSVYITAGGAGAPLYPVNEKDFLAKGEMAYHFVLVDVKKEVSKTTISLETWCMPEDFSDLYLFDNITISK
ncbi:MAG: metallophosphoesterase family protein [Promethearchaeota archaeon]|nr:MAG: metallophosphoesterase family protein [Candidatus Lokiarchaeota archaeon]